MAGKALTDDLLGQAVGMLGVEKLLTVSEGESDGKKRWLLSPMQKSGLSGEFIVTLEAGQPVVQGGGPEEAPQVNNALRMLIADLRDTGSREPTKSQERPRKSEPGRINAIVQRNGQVGALVKPRDLSQITPADISKMFCPEATEEEAAFFLEICLRRGLNPFAGDAYLVKYGGQNPKAMTIVSKESFFKKAEVNPQYDGIESGLILAVDDKIEEREGAFYLKAKETILGGWAKVYRKDRKVPSIAKVSFDEFRGKSPFWVDKPAIMIKKVAEVHALRQAFSNDLGGLYEGAEMDIDPAKEIKQEVI
jgi:phage recombination protein Bet